MREKAAKCSLLCRMRESQQSRAPSSLLPSLDLSKSRPGNSHRWCKSSSGCPPFLAEGLKGQLLNTSGEGESSSSDVYPQVSPSASLGQLIPVLTETTWLNLVHHKTKLEGWRESSGGGLTGGGKGGAQSRIDKSGLRREGGAQSDLCIVWMKLLRTNLVNRT